jgi:hypothetical protein
LLCNSILNKFQWNSFYLTNWNYKSHYQFNLVLSQFTFCSIVCQYSTRRRFQTTIPFRDSSITQGRCRVIPLSAIVLPSIITEKRIHPLCEWDVLETLKHQIFFFLFYFKFIWGEIKIIKNIRVALVMDKFLFLENKWPLI